MLIDRILMDRIHINEQTERLVDSLMLIYRKKRQLFCGLCTEELDKSDVYMRLNLQFFAEGEGGEKTEDATAKKLDQAREEGQVAKSQELVIGVTLLMLFISLKVKH